VVSSLAPEVDSAAVLNVNADTAAAALAVALKAAKLVLLTDVPGLYDKWPDTESVVSSMTADELEALCRVSSRE
jgi:acetylglutamate kinase